MRERIAQLYAAEGEQNEREQDEEGFLTPGAAAPALRFLPCQFTLSSVETSSVAGRV